MSGGYANADRRVPARADTRDRAGFTLAELIVASTLLTIVMASVYTAFHSAIRTWRGGETNYETYQDARAFMGLIGRELQAIPAGTRGYFQATEDEIEFYTMAPPLHVEDGTHPRVLWVRYSLGTARSSDGRTLEREEAVVTGPLPLPPPPGQEVEPERIELGRRRTFTVAKNVEDFQLTFKWVGPFNFKDDVPPPYIEPLIKHVNRREWGLPHAIDIAVSFIDPGNDGPDRVTDFYTSVVIRGHPGGIPKGLAEEWYRLYPRG